MDKKLKGILDILDKLNSKINIVSKEDLNEQYENLEEFRELTSELDIILNNFDSLDQNDGDEIEKMLFELHRILTTFEWHFSEISDLNTKILKVYKDKINNV
jgi:oligoendopeptidase F